MSDDRSEFLHWLETKNSQVKRPLWIRRSLILVACLAFPAGLQLIAHFLWDSKRDRVEDSIYRRFDKLETTIQSADDFLLNFDGVTAYAKSTGEGENKSKYSLSFGLEPGKLVQITVYSRDEETGEVSRAINVNRIFVTSHQERRYQLCETIWTRRVKYLDVQSKGSMGEQGRMDHDRIRYQSEDWEPVEKSPEDGVRIGLFHFPEFLPDKRNKVWVYAIFKSYDLRRNSDVPSDYHSGWEGWKTEVVDP